MLLSYTIKIWVCKKTLGLRLKNTVRKENIAIHNRGAMSSSKP